MTLYVQTDTLKMYRMYVQSERSDKMSPKMGQKLTDNPRSVRLEVRLTQEENALLEECAKRLQVTKTKVITKGIELVDKDSRN